MLYRCFTGQPHGQPEITLLPVCTAAKSGGQSCKTSFRRSVECYAHYATKPKPKLRNLTRRLRQRFGCHFIDRPALQRQYAVTSACKPKIVSH